MKLDSAVFYTNDIEKVVGFYRNQLSLKIDFVKEDRFASFLFENGVKLGIKKATEEREVPGKQTIFIDAPNIEELYEQYKTKNFTFYKHLEDIGWGVQFSILDSDGNKILFLRRKSK